jgi:hypothetical protein
MMINDPYVFNRNGDLDSINKCVKQAQDNGDLQKEREDGQLPVSLIKTRNIPLDVQKEYRGPPFYMGNITPYERINEEAQK